MTAIFLFCLILIMGALGICRYYRSFIVFFIFTALICIWVGGGFLPRLGLRNLQIDFSSTPPIVWKDRNAIVLLGAGTVNFPQKNVLRPSIIAYSRIHEATHLYRVCKSKPQRGCTILVSGGDPYRKGSSEADVYAAALENLGVPTADIELEAKSLNTYQNAEFTSTLLREQKFDQVFLVTSAIHLRRASLYFSHFGIETVPVAADFLNSVISYLPIGYNFTMADFALHEYIGILRFHAYQIFGLNHPYPAAGVA